MEDLVSATYSCHGFLWCLAQSKPRLRHKLRGLISFVLGLSRELVGYGDHENEHRVLIHRVMALPLVVRVMWFGRGEAFWNW